MPVDNEGGVILIGSSDKELRRAIGESIRRNFVRETILVGETSDFLLEILDKKIDLTIIDLNLSGLPIEKTIGILRRCRPTVPVIVLSDDYSVATGSRIMEQGVFYYLYKPLDMEHLREIIESALKKRAREKAEEGR